MSKAFVINTKWLSNKINKAREYLKPKHSVNKLFGATDLYLQYTQGFDKLALASLEAGQSPSLNPPPLPPLPKPLGFPDAQPVIKNEPKEIENTANTNLPDRGTYLIPVLEDNTAQIEHFEKNKDRNELDDFLSSLEETGFKVSEVEKLASGVTRISVKDLIGMGNTPEPELVKVRG
jgi:hypothetical protein